jgi:hypothetical protein
MLRHTLAVLVYSILAFAGSLMASTDFAPSVPARFPVPVSGLAQDTSRTDTAFSELPDAPSAVMAALEIDSAAQTPQYETLQRQPQSGPDMALEMPPEIHFAPLESADFVPEPAPNPLPPSLPDASGFHLFLRRSSTPAAFASSFFDAAMAQHKNEWPGYRRGVEGFSKRYAALLADRTANRFFGGFLMPTLFHQNPRYLRLGPGLSLWRRMEYSISRVVLTHSQAGGDTLNGSLLLSIALSKSVQNLYYPRQQRGFDLTLRRTEKSLLNQLQSNLESEFLPDLERFLWTHLPARIRRFEKRIPFSREWEPESFSG